MFSVIFEVHPKKTSWEAYLGEAKMLKPELDQIDGFVDNVRYASLTRQGWILSLSNWRDEKAVVRWRTRMRHHQAQEKGRNEILQDYHLRVGEVTGDTRLPQGHVLQEQRLDETEVGTGKMVTLVDSPQPTERVKNSTPQEVALRLGFHPAAEGLVSWDVFEAVLTPGDTILLLTWHTALHAKTFAAGLEDDKERRTRHVRIVRDYGMFDRREAPQYYPDVGT